MAAGPPVNFTWERVESLKRPQTIARLFVVVGAYPTLSALVLTIVMATLIRLPADYFQKPSRPGAP